MSKFKIRKKMLKSISENSNKLIKVSKRSTLTDKQFENCFGSDIFTDEITDESYEYSNESDEEEINTTLLTLSFKITPCETDGNCHFNVLNNIIFEGQLTAEYIREEICDFIVKYRQMYEHL